MRRGADGRHLFKKSYCQDYPDYICADQRGKLLRPSAGIDAHLDDSAQEASANALSEIFSRAEGEESLA